MNMGSNLQEALSNLQDFRESGQGAGMQTHSDANILDFVVGLINNTAVDTIACRYGTGEAVVWVAYQTHRSVTTFDITDMEYLDFCSKLGVNTQEEYNSSISRVVDGVFTRIFSVNPPTTLHPEITISTTKHPPETWTQQGFDQVLSEVMQDSFVVVGRSGAGKTYLLNYMLSKYADPMWHVAFIEEFGELIPYNNHVMQLQVKPGKPDQESNLKFITEQSNLMRLDRFYIGEVKGAEAWPAVLNMSSGTKGAFTIHGDSWDDGMRRLQSLCMMSQPNEQVVNQFIAKAIKYVIVVQNHRIHEIQRLTGTCNQGRFAATEIYGGA